MEEVALNYAANRMSGGSLALKQSLEQERGTVALLERATETAQQQASAVAGPEKGAGAETGGQTGNGANDGRRGSQVDIRA